MKTTKISTASIVFQHMLKVALGALFLVVLNSCSSDSETNKTVTTQDASSTTAPEFSLTSLDNKTVKLSDYKNKVVTLFIFGNECPSCKAVGQKISIELGDAYGARNDYQILGIDQWDGNAAKVLSFKTVTNINFPLLLNGSSVTASYKTTYDRIVVIDKTGKIMFSGTQGASSDIAAAKAKIEELLK
jgi:peroxiredoxin